VEPLSDVEDLLEANTPALVEAMLDVELLFETWELAKVVGEVEVFKVVNAADENEYPAREEPELNEVTTPNAELVAVDEVTKVVLGSAPTEDRRESNEFDEVALPKVELVVIAEAGKVELTNIGATEDGRYNRELDNALALDTKVEDPLMANAPAAVEAADEELEAVMA
jgi:hypothetical protein